MTPAVFFAGVMTLLWPHAHGPGTLIPLALFYGAGSGAFVGLMCAPLIALGDSRDVGRRIGMFLTILSLGALAGPPISGAIVSATGGYDAVGNYAGMFPPLPSPPFSILFLCPVRG
jgi:MCP family monocarboxylic acid transporter-like MFS transporter 10